MNETDSIKPDGRKYELGGNDNYFNNGIYIKGWTFREMLMGNPLITSPAILKGEGYDYIRNNKIIAHHLGIEGHMTKITYKLLYTYSLNYGTNHAPISPGKTNHSILLNTQFEEVLPWKLNFTCAIGADFGKCMVIMPGS